MPSKLIQLENGVYAEIEAAPGETIERISSEEAEQVAGSIDKIKDILLQTTQPLAETWRELNKDMSIKQAEVEIGLGFAAEGNLFIAKSKGNANLKVKLIMQPKDEPTHGQ